MAVDIIDQDHVIVVAERGEIHFSSDRAQSWQRAHLPAVAGLRAVSMADRVSGWVVGDGVILRTDDGGSSWRRQRLPNPANRVRLVSVSAIDREVAIAVGENGVRLRTQDGGRIWQDVSQPSTNPSEGPDSIRDVFCLRESKGRCWSVGATFEYTRDVGQSWQRVEVEDFARIDPIVFGIGEVEVTSLEAERFERFVSANRRRRPLEWRIEPGISAHELEQVGHRRDPDALFELVDARVQEVRSMIEEAGVPADRVVTNGMPPWDYEDYLDEDPDLLDRYWTMRSAPKSSVRVRVVDDPTLFSLRVHARGLGLAVGAKGALLRSDDAGTHWIMNERLSPHDLLAVGIGRRRVVVVGDQGGIWVSQDEGRSWQSPSGDAYAPFFDALRAISFSPGGEFGLIVGARGSILRSFDGGEAWELLVREGGGCRAGREESPGQTESRLSS